jgi:large subunit ribosomal protein L15
MIRRLPKMGFNNAVFKEDFEVVNVGQLEKLFAAGETVDEAALRAKGLVRRDADGIKILGDGALTKKLAVKVHRITKGAQEKIAKAGGSSEELTPRPAPKPKVDAKAPAAKPAGEKKPAAPKSPEGEAPKK